MIAKNLKMSFSKLKKLIMNPKKFFLDSLYFKKIDIKIESKGNNIFVVSHLSQLERVEKFIKINQIQKNILIILYTKKNIIMPKLINSNLNKTCFNESILIELPINPNDFSIKKNIYIKRLYQYLIDNISARNIYFLSFENHYCLLHNIASLKGMKLYLIEEGTATYKDREESNYIKCNSFIKKFIFKFFKIENTLGDCREYNEVFGFFPKKLSCLFSAKKFTFFNPFILDSIEKKDISKLFYKYKISSNDYIFLLQRYNLNNELYINNVIKIALLFINENNKVFFKLHPKNSKLFKEIFQMKIKDYNNLFIIDEKDFQIELIISKIQLKGVIGLTSSTLIYTPVINKNIISYSIYPLFVKLLPKKDISLHVLEVMEKHFSILKKFENIEYIYSETDIMRLTNK